MSGLLGLALLAGATSTVGEGLFSAEELPSPGGLFADEPLPATPMAELPSPGGGIEARASASARVDALLDPAFDRDGEQIVDLRFAAGLRLEVEPTRDLSLFAAPRLSYLVGFTREGDDRGLFVFEAPEAHLTYALGPVTLRGGLLVAAWGSSEVFAPADVLNPLDLRQSLFSTTSMPKLPVPAIEAIARLGPLAVRAFVQPIFVPSRFTLYEWDTSLGALAGAFGLPMPDLGGLLSDATRDRILDQGLAAERPEDSPANTTFGLRATLSAGDLELSATFVHGFETLPRVVLDPNLAILMGELARGFAERRPISLFEEPVASALAGVLTGLEEGRALFRGTHPRRTLVGVDLSCAVGPLLLKADVAYTLSRTFYTQTFTPVEKPYLAAAAGLEYVHGERLQVLLEAWSAVVFDVGAGERLLIFEGLGGPAEARTVFFPAAALVVRSTLLDGDLDLELAAVLTLLRQDLVLAPQVRYRLDRHQSVRLYASVLEGRRDGFGGIYSHNDQLGVAWEIEL